MVEIYLADLSAGDQLDRPIAAGRHAWLQVLRGAVTLDDQLLSTSDAAAVSQQDRLAIRATDDAEVMLFDLA